MTFFFSGRLSGRAQTLTTTIGGQILASASVSTWGASAGSGGTVAISVDRTNLQCAPDSVRFTVDLSSTTFDSTETYSAVSGNTYNSAYDPRLHDHIFLWDLGDVGVWDTPANVLTEWKSKRYAKGPFVSHMYNTPGTYTASLLVVEPSSGKWSRSADVSLNVAAQGDVYAEANMIFVNPIGDTDFLDAPAGAQKVNLDTLYSDTAEWIANRGTSSAWYFKRGGAWDVGLSITDGVAGNMFFGDYGSGARPVINNQLDQNQNRVFNITNTYNPAPAERTDLRLFNLDFQGGFDPSSMEIGGVANPNVGRAVIIHGSPMDAMVSNCRVQGFRNSSFGHGVGTAELSIQQNFHYDNVHLTDFGGQYAIITESLLNPNSSFSFTGCGFIQNPLASSVDTQMRALARVNGIALTHGRGTEMFHTRGTGQPVFKLEENPTKITGQYEDGHIVNIHSCVFEGGNQAPVRLHGLINNSGSITRPLIGNHIFDGNIFIANWSSDSFVRTNGMGLTLRNNLGFKHEIPDDSPTTRRILGFVLADNDKPDAITASITAPITVYNNTMWVLNGEASQVGFAPLMIRMESSTHDFPDLVDANNVRYIPNLNAPDDVTTHAPHTTATLFDSRTLGQIEAGFVLNATYAHTTPIVEAGLAPGSIGINAAAGDHRRLAGAGARDDLAAFFTGTPLVAFASDIGWLEAN
ncbi:hypothetical protein [uncultured Roseobacter sp.]|uniref:hypothetical protein n=1 Tax=uncultured Roseobacter sp. TaxID=114847 RepID=UPI002621F1CC|nr:hypothetical protein [uncultured Roseobacter sp.]